MQYGYLALLAATLAGTSTATQYGSSNMGSENNNNMGGESKMMGGESKMMGGEQQKQQQQYQPPPGSCWQGMSQVSDMKQMGVVIISNNDGGMNNKWNMVSQQNNYMPNQKSAGMTHQVTVGGSKGLVFDPPTLAAQPGDMVQFNFMDKNHTVTQSSFDKPCVKMMGGMDSGFMPNPGNMVNPAPAMKVQVMDSKPMWFYCKQKMPKPHCGSGMAFSINPTMEKSQDAFVKAAMAQNGTGMGMMAPPPPPPPPSNVAMPQSNTVQGMGSMQNGQCQCQCLCGSNQYAAGLGIGQMGGIGGMISMSSPGGDSKMAPPAMAAPPAMPAMPESQAQPGVADGA